MKHVRTFTIRPKAIKGESLSGYLMRLAKANYMTARNLFRIISESSIRRFDSICNYIQIDLIPQRYVLDEDLFRLLKITTYELRTMTFIPVYEKFLENVFDAAKEEFATILRNNIIRDHRRFCPQCLKELEVYKLEWQIEDIKICDIHNTCLTTKCPACGKEQPYISDYLSTLQCCFCKSNLYEKPIINVDSDFYNRQVKIVNAWRSLMDKRIVNNISIDGLTKMKSVAIVFLFMLQTDGTYFEPKKIMHRDKADIYKTIRYIHDREIKGKITPFLIVKYLTSLEIEVSSFFNLIVPNSYINSILNFYDDETEKRIARFKTSGKLLEYKHSANIEKKIKNELEFYKILDNLEDILKRKVINFEKILINDIYIELGINRRYINERALLKERIRMKILEYKLLWQAAYDSKYSHLVKGTVFTLFTNEVKITYSNVAKELNISTMTIKRNDRLKQAIYDVKQELGI